MPRIRHNMPDVPIVALPLPTTAVSVQLVGRDCVLFGFALAETSGVNPAVIDFIDGGDDSGAELVPVNLDARGSTRELPQGYGLAVQSGLRLKVTSGSVRGAVYVYLPIFEGE